MAPQQDPNNPPQTTSEPTNETSSNDPSVEDQLVDDSRIDVDTAPPETSTSLEVENDGFVAERSIDRELVSVDEKESFESQLAPVLSPKKSKKRLYIIIAAVATAILLGGGSVFAFWYNAPDKSVEDALGHLLNAKSLKAQGVISIQGKDTSPTNIKLDFDVMANDAALSTNIDFGIDIGEKTSTVKGNLVMTKDMMAVKLTNFRDLIGSAVTNLGVDASVTDLFDSLITKVDNKWVVITKDDLNKYSNNDDSDKKLTCAQNVITVFRTNKVQQNELSALYKNNRFIVVSKSLGTEIVNSKLSNRYELTIDNEKNKSFVDKLPQTAIYKAIDDCYEGDISRGYEQNQKEADQVSNDYGKLELWIDALSHSPTKFKITSDDTDTTTSLVNTIELNTSSQISVPTADTTFEDLQTEFNKIQQGIFGGSALYEGTMDTTVLGIRNPI